MSLAARALYPSRTSGLIAFHLADISLPRAEKEIFP